MKTFRPDAEGAVHFLVLGSVMLGAGVMVNQPFHYAVDVVRAQYAALGYAWIRLLAALVMAGAVAVLPAKRYPVLSEWAFVLVSYVGVLAGSSVLMLGIPHIVGVSAVLLSGGALLTASAIGVLLGIHGFHWMTRGVLPDNRD